MSFGHLTCTSQIKVLHKPQQALQVPKAVTSLQALLRRCQRQVPSSASVTEFGFIATKDNSTPVLGSPVLVADIRWCLWFSMNRWRVWLAHLLPMGWSLALLWRLEGWKSSEQPSGALFCPLKHITPKSDPHFSPRTRVELFLQPLG